MSLQEPLEDRILPLLEGLQKTHRRTFRAVVARLHYPKAKNKEINFIAETSESLGSTATRLLRDVGWTPAAQDDDDLTLLLDLYPLTPQENVRAAKAFSPKTANKVEPADSDHSDEGDDIPSFSRMISDGSSGMLPSQFVGYGKWVLNRKRSEGSHRVRRDVLNRLLELFPEFERTRGRIGGVIYSCLSNMHFEELEKFCEYYMDTEKTAQYVYNWHGHEGQVPFCPLMIYPNLDPVVAQMVSLSEDHARDWQLLEELNRLPPLEQKRLINPPTLYKKYVVYPNPQSQYELAGFDADDITNREFIVAKSSIQSDDIRTKLLNCINIIQSRFPTSEAGCQEMRRLTDGLIQVCMSGDKKEIGIWHDAFIQAPTIKRIIMANVPMPKADGSDPDNLPDDDSPKESTDDLEGLEGLDGLEVE